MFAKVKIITANNPNAVIIPSQAIVERQGKSVVYITQDGGEGKSVREAEVEVGIISDGRAEIRSGVNAKDEVVDKGMSLLTDGVRVNIINTRSEADGAGGGL